MDLLHTRLELEPKSFELCLEFSFLLFDFGYLGSHDSGELLVGGCSDFLRILFSDGKNMKESGM